MKCRLKFFILFLLVLPILSEKSKYNNYQKPEIVKFFNKGSNSVSKDLCLVTSLPLDFKSSGPNPKFYDIFYDKDNDFCNTTNLSLEGAQAVLVLPSMRCGMVQQKANCRALNVKVLVYITTNIVALPDSPNELNKSPAVVLMPRQVFNEIQKGAPWDILKIGIYVPPSTFNLWSKTTEMVAFGIVATTILLTMVLTIFFSKNIMDNNDSMESVNLGQVKYLSLVLPLSMIGMLLLLYFFYFVMVWIVIVLFFILSAYCFTLIMGLFMEKYDCFPSLKIPFNKYGLRFFDWRYVVLFVLGLVISTAWIINRNNMTGVVLNNIMGVYVCAEVAISLAVMFVISRNFKILLVILATVLLIDAVMVYVPIKNNKPDISQQIALFRPQDLVSRVRRSDSSSLMENVATAMGGSSSEEIPIRFKIPKLGFAQNASSESCQKSSREYSLIGFGDLILPGAFIVYMLLFAVIGKSSIIIYFCITFFGYMTGLGLTYVALILSSKGQPALVFLLPCTVLPTLLVAVIRKEFMTLWNHSWYSEEPNDGFNELKQDSEDRPEFPEKVEMQQNHI